MNNTFLLVVLFTICAPMAWADTLSDNLGALTDYTEIASGSSWVTAGFGTGPSSYNLTNVTLLLSNPTPGTAQVDLYSNVSGQPSSLLTILNAPSSYSSDLTNTTFSSTGYNLSPNAAYWVVLKGLSGSFEWAYTDSSIGSGIGFQHTWGISDDAGESWFTSDIQPMQMSVQASAVPEPSTGGIVLTALGVFALAMRRWTRIDSPKFLPMRGCCLNKMLPVNHGVAEGKATELEHQTRVNPSCRETVSNGGAYAKNRNPQRVCGSDSLSPQVCFTVTRAES